MKGNLVTLTSITWGIIVTYPRVLLIQFLIFPTLHSNTTDVIIPMNFLIWKEQYSAMCNVSRAKANLIIKSSWQESGHLRGTDSYKAVGQSINLIPKWNCNCQQSQRTHYLYCLCYGTRLASKNQQSIPYSSKIPNNRQREPNTQSRTRTWLCPASLLTIIGST